MGLASSELPAQPVSKAARDSPVLLVHQDSVVLEIEDRPGVQAVRATLAGLVSLVCRDILALPDYRELDFRVCIATGR